MATAAPTIALALSLLSSDALASGFSTARFGGEHGHPTTSNPTAIYYNPAGIAESEGFHLFLDGNLAFRAATYTHVQGGADVDEPADAQGANNGEATLLNVAVAPMLGATYKIADFAIGAGFYVPFGGVATWDKNLAFDGHPRYPGPVDGAQRWYAIEGSFRSSFITLAAGYHIKPARLSLGVSGNLILSSVDTIRARNADGSNAIIDSAGRQQEGRAHLDVSGLSFSFGAGAIFEAIAKTLWIGASYQSRPNVAGGIVLDGTLTTKFGTGDPYTQDDATLTYDLPDIIRLGVRARPREDIELRLFGDYSRWSAFKDQCIGTAGKECAVNENGSEVTVGSVTQNIPRRWNDAFGVRAGISQFPEEGVELFAGLGYDGNAVPDETFAPDLSDFHDISVSLGGRFQVAEPLFVGASYTHIFYVKRDNSGESKLSGYQSPSVIPDAGGIYTQTIGVVNVNVEAVF